MNEKNLMKSIKDLENYKTLFCKGLKFPEEKIFIDIILKLNNHIDEITNPQIKESVQKFINEVLKHKNFNVYMTALKEKEEREKQREIARQKREEQRQIQELAERKERESAYKIISDISQLFENGDIDCASKIYKEHEQTIEKHDFLFSIKFSKKECLYNIIKARKIKYLCHFTNVKNLKSILINGIIPRQIMDERGISYICSDLQRYDNKLDCTSFSVEYPNYKMLSWKQNISNDNTYIVIILDAIKILLNDLEKYYVYVNAAKSNARYCLDNYNMTTPLYFQNMFSNKVDNVDRTDDIPDYITTNPQAEILVKGIIDQSNILEIHFADNTSFEKFKTMCDDSSILQDKRITISNFYFQNRESVNWEKR